MPADVLTPEIAARFGALDSDAVVDGAAVTAHVLRAAARSAHRLLAKPEPVLAALYDTRAADTEARAMSGPALPWWTLVERWPIERMQGRDSIDVRVTLRVPSGTVVRVQLATRGQPFDPAPAVGRYKTTSSSGSWEVVEFDGVPLAPGEEDELELYIAADVGSTLGATGTYGSPATGVVQEVQQATMRTTASTTWNLTGATWTWEHMLVFLGTGGALLTTPRVVTGVRAASPQGVLEFAPAMSPAEGALLRGSTYEIRQLARWRLASVVAVTTERTAL